MKVSELIEKLGELPPDAEVTVSTECHGCWGSLDGIVQVEGKDGVSVELVGAR